MSEIKKVKTLTINGEKYDLVSDEVDGNKALLKFKRTLNNEMPTLDSGEIGFATDTKKLYIGSEDGNVQLAGPDFAATIENPKGDGILYQYGGGIVVMLDDYTGTTTVYFNDSLLLGDPDKTGKYGLYTKEKVELISCDCDGDGISIANGAITIKDGEVKFDMVLDVVETVNRPEEAVLGTMIFDEDLGAPIFWNGTE